MISETQADALSQDMEGDAEAMELQRTLVRSFFFDKCLKSKPVSLKALERKYDRISIDFSNAKGNF